MQLSHRHFTAYRNDNFTEHIASVHADIHLHNRYAGFFFALHDRIMDRRRTAVFGQQRSVYIDAS